MTNPLLYDRSLMKDLTYFIIEYSDLIDFKDAEHAQWAGELLAEVITTGGPLADYINQAISNPNNKIHKAVLEALIQASL